MNREKIDSLKKLHKEMMLNRVEWGEDRPLTGPFLMIGDWDGSAWRFWEQESGSVRWYPVPSTPTLVAKAEKLAKGRALKRNKLARTETSPREKPSRVFRSNEFVPGEAPLSLAEVEDKCSRPGETIDIGAIEIDIQELDVKLILKLILKAPPEANRVRRRRITRSGGHGAR